MSNRNLELVPLSAIGIAVVATVVTFGQLTLQAFLAVLAAGLVISAVGLARRAGSGVPPVGPAGRVWLGWLVTGTLWEALMFARNSRFPTLSDLLDPALAHPAVRGLATVGWLALGRWLITRPAGPRE